MWVVPSHYVISDIMQVGSFSCTETQCDGNLKNYNSMVFSYNEYLNYTGIKSSLQ